MFTRLAGLVHDIGKLTVPAEILAKPARPAEIEFELTKCHSAAAFDTLGSIDSGQPVADIVIQRHERQDGFGYPTGLAGDVVLPLAGMLPVSDVVEAMASHRLCRAALGVEAALEEIRSGAGTRYDADAAPARERVFRLGFDLEELRA
jgi:HD-GYP domain-containing protein (c-di-GMP phosphodiesterase class II)